MIGSVSTEPTDPSCHFVDAWVCSDYFLAFPASALTYMSDLDVSASSTQANSI
jgi:hypothetical protein